MRSDPEKIMPNSKNWSRNKPNPLSFSLMNWLMIIDYWWLLIIDDYWSRKTSSSSLFIDENFANFASGSGLLYALPPLIPPGRPQRCQLFIQRRELIQDLLQFGTWPRGVWIQVKSPGKDRDFPWGNASMKLAHVVRGRVGVWKGHEEWAAKRMCKMWFVWVLPCWVSPFNMDQHGASWSLLGHISAASYNGRTPIIIQTYTMLVLKLPWLWGSSIFRNSIK